MNDGDNDEQERNGAHAGAEARADEKAKESWSQDAEEQMGEL